MDKVVKRALITQVDNLKQDVDALETAAAAILGGMSENAINAEGIHNLLQCLAAKFLIDVRHLEDIVHSQRSS